MSINSEILDKELIDNHQVADNDVVISIIIDDLGNRLGHGERVIALPGAVTCSIFPKNKYSEQIAHLAKSANKEVMLHLPMQSMDSNRLGVGGVILDMTKEEFERVVNDDIDSIPNLVGINNHMGSLLTQHPGHMLWLMDIIKQRGNLFFLDSRTTKSTAAEKIAIEAEIPNTRRDVFLDHDVNIVAIKHQFSRLIKLAEKYGSAVAIGHPFDETLIVLENELPLLAQKGIKLVSVAEMIRMRSKAKLQ